jgi:hypothetical protein
MSALSVPLSCCFSEVQFPYPYRSVGTAIIYIISAIFPYYQHLITQRIYETAV